MIFKYLDANGRRLHEGDTVLLIRPHDMVIGQIVFYAHMGAWSVKKEKEFSPTLQQFIPVNPGAVDAYASLHPHMPIFSRVIKNLELLSHAARPKRREYDAPLPYLY
ncbi:MAG: hypothetical protein IJP04_12195 [Clostridia bacterium]|nr:hypothetical protein [Clostridia bacterium]